MERFLVSIVILITVVSCSQRKYYYFDKAQNPPLYANQSEENIHRPIQLDLTEEWLNRANKIDSLDNFIINAIGENYISIEIKNKGFSFDEIWLNKNTYSSQTNSVLINIAEHLSISVEETKLLIIGFFELGLNRYSKKEHFTIFENERWMTHNKGYIFFPKNYKIKQNVIINVNQLTNGNYRKGWWNNYLIKKKINDNWFEFYRSSGLKPMSK